MKIQTYVIVHSWQVQSFTISDEILKYNLWSQYTDYTGTVPPPHLLPPLQFPFQPFSHSVHIQHHADLCQKGLKREAKQIRAWEASNVTNPICGLSVNIQKLLSSDSSQLCDRFATDCTEKGIKWDITFSMCKMSFRISNFVLWL